MKPVLSLSGYSINPGFLGTQLPIQRIKKTGANSWPLTLRLNDVVNSFDDKNKSTSVIIQLVPHTDHKVLPLVRHSANATWSRNC